MLSKDTDFTIVTTIISKRQKRMLQKLSDIRKVSKAKVLRQIIDDYFRGSPL